MVECRDSDIFITIPCLLILKSLEEEGATVVNQICKRFFPLMFLDQEDSGKKYFDLKEEFQKLKATYTSISKNSKSTKSITVYTKKMTVFEFFNNIEK